MVITLKEAGGLVVPLSVQRKAGLRAGDKIEFQVLDGVIHIVPKAPKTDEYSPRQRRVVDAKIAESEKGPQHGPFDSAGAAIDFLDKEIAARKAKRKASR